jgi:hypothetical protein
MFIFSTASTLALGSTQPPIQRARWAASSDIKRQWREANQSPPSGAEIKNGEDIFSL